MRIQATDCPLLYEINSRLWVRELGRQKKDFSLARIPEEVLDKITALNFDLVWLMGVWQTGEVGQAIARQQSLQEEYKQTLPDWAPEDVVGSPYAVQSYRISDRLGGPQAMAYLRSRLARRGIGLILDFVPNHTARDHPWVFSHPEFYIHGDQDTLRREPKNFFSTETAQGKRILAHGRDPHFPGWSDTTQLNYCHPDLRAAMIETLVRIAGQCDGVRCDMSMLVLREVFSRTWEKRARAPGNTASAEGEFWAEAIDAVRRRYPDFIFIAEVYWGLESELQSLGFDYTYDKGLYDRLLYQGAGAVREHLHTDLDFQLRSARFLENHDEPRVAKLLPANQHLAAALICYTLPGMRLFHEGQLDGRKAKVPVQLARRPVEQQDRDVADFYQKLLAELGEPVMRRGRWKLLKPKAAWNGNHSWEQFVIHRLEGKRGSRVVVANFGPQQAQCYVSLDLTALQGRRVVLRDLLSGVTFEREGNSMINPGLYLDMAPYQVHFFAVAPL